MNRPPITVIATETSGLKAEDQVIAIGAVTLAPDGRLEAPRASFIALREGVTISPDARAVHGIAPDMLDGAPTTHEALLALAIHGPGPLAAHGAGRERRFLPQLLTDLDTGAHRIWLDTEKLALARWPQASSHAVPALFQDLGGHWKALGYEAARAAGVRPAAEAGGEAGDLAGSEAPDTARSGARDTAWDTAWDAIQAACLLAAILDDPREGWSLTWCESVSRGPARIVTMPFGKHKGERFEALPQGYLDWLCSPAGPRSHPEVIAAALAERGRRRPARGSAHA